MSRVIEILISPKGETTVQTRGFAGSSCRDASRFTAAESVEQLRQWASGRCLDAEGGGIYRADGVGFVSKPGRKVRRQNPSNN